MLTPASQLSAPIPDRLLRRPEVEHMTGMSTARLYSAMREGRFPRPRRIGKGPHGAVGWPLSEVQDWMANLPVADLQHPGQQ